MAKCLQIIIGSTLCTYFILSYLLSNLTPILHNWYKHHLLRKASGTTSSASLPTLTCATSFSAQQLVYTSTRVLITPHYNYFYMDIPTSKEFQVHGRFLISGQNFFPQKMYLYLFIKSSQKH